jgi:hypothetical protein
LLCEHIIPPEELKANPDLVKKIFGLSFEQLPAIYREQGLTLPEGCSSLEECAAQIDSENRRLEAEGLRYPDQSNDEEWKRFKAETEDILRGQTPVYIGLAGLPRDYKTRGVCVERSRRVLERSSRPARARSASRQYHRVGRTHTASISKRGSPDDSGDSDSDPDQPPSEPQPPSVTPTKHSKRLIRAIPLWRRHGSCHVSTEGRRSL